MTCAYAPSGNFVACGGLDNICSIYNLKVCKWTCKRRVCEVGSCWKGRPSTMQICLLAPHTLPDPVPRSFPHSSPPPRHHITALSCSHFIVYSSSVRLALYPFSLSPLPFPQTEYKRAALIFYIDADARGGRASEPRACRSYRLPFLLPVYQRQGDCH